jgi:hypothetical protein
MQESKPFLIRRLASRPELREVGLQIIGALFATLILALSVAVTVNMRTHRLGPDTAALRLSDQGLWSSTLKHQTSPGSEHRGKARRKNRNIRRELRVELPSEPLRTFALPHRDDRLPEPDSIELYPAPVVASIADDPIAPPLAEYVLPPRPRGGIARVFLALAHPFRNFRRWLVRGREPAVLAD